MYIADHKFAVERMPDVFGNPKRLGNMWTNPIYCDGKREIKIKYVTLTLTVWPWHLLFLECAARVTAGMHGRDRDFVKWARLFLEC